MSATSALSPAMTADLNFFQKAEKSDSANAFGNDNRSKIVVSQIGPRIPRKGANNFSPDGLIVPFLSFRLPCPTSDGSWLVSSCQHHRTSRSTGKLTRVCLDKLRKGSRCSDQSNCATATRLGTDRTAVGK